MATDAPTRRPPSGSSTVPRMAPVEASCAKDKGRRKRTTIQERQERRMKSHLGRSQPGRMWGNHAFIYSKLQRGGDVRDGTAECLFYVAISHQPSAFSIQPRLFHEHDAAHKLTC